MTSTDPSASGRERPHPAEPAEHFASRAQQDHAARLGMWLFLTSEVLLFGALIGLYTGYRLRYGKDFAEAAHHNNVWLGTANTLILVTSSFFAAWAVRAISLARIRTALVSFATTILLAVAFLALKSIEYGDHFAHHIFPGSYYAFPALPSHGANLFFTLYFVLTGLHALHVLGGMTALGVVTVNTLRGRYGPERYLTAELVVLYWHLVDVIWIFLWPLLYLGGPQA
jgi:cytochrome c oxidase subunit 3